MTKKDVDKDPESTTPTVGARVVAFLNPFRATHKAAVTRQTHNHKHSKGSKGHNGRSAPSPRSGTSKAHASASHTRLKLLDLDRTRNELDVEIAPTTVAARLEATIRNRNKKQPLADSDLLHIYWLCKPGNGTRAPGPQQLRPSDVVSAVCPRDATLYYRVIAADDAERGRGQHLEFRVEWLSPLSAPSASNSNGHRGSLRDRERKGDGRQKRAPSPDFLRELARDIFSTDRQLAVGAVRSRLAAVLGVDDPNRIALLAYSGLQPCQPLAGIAWQVGRLLTAWLCRCLLVQVHPPKRYVVVRGGGGVLRDGDGADRGLRCTYLYHEMTPGARSSSAEVSMAVVQKWVRDHLLKSVNRHAASQLQCKSRHIEMVGSAREAPRQRSKVQWGSSVEFRLRDDVVEAFADDETWLLPLTETCMICLEDKAVTEMPHRITAACLRHANHSQRHTPTLCKPCLAEWIGSSLKGSVWNRLRCPECPARLSYADVRLYATPSVFERYDTLATRAALVSEFPNFRWCLAVGCEAGQIHGPASRSASARSVEEECPKFRCHACRATHCIRHNIPWHSSETCAQYDARTQRRRQDNRKSEAFVQETSKQCPGCNKAVFKYSGCNHISCICGHEWCYICFAPFVQSDYGILRCQHKPECTEQDLFDELGLNPNRRRGPRPVPLLWRAGQQRPRWA
ncbi:ring finger protein [Grosmannia clavigera kw1407]|uniref:RBR-type E3 ubiquitin transferase n=1 Tax=Grosmannia clavigera (strain kw1407 / UAMH 11150) TaxID=655863 RepID=F0XRS0_GROCL|nr:ring finger protein [Grosmannia clavigera kw1407]EFW99546.1 ring finger protein [Grosmannia clavigera kw1407]